MVSTVDGFKMREYAVETGGDPVIDIDAEDVTVQNMDLYLEAFVGNEPSEVRVQEGSHGAKVLQNVIDRGFEGGHPAIVVTQGADDVLIEGNEVAENGSSAIAAGVGDGCTITVLNNVVHNGYDEGIWFWPVHENGIIVIEGNVVHDYEVGGTAEAPLKIVSKPGSVNGVADENQMEAAILDANPGIESVYLQWL